MVIAHGAELRGRVLAFETRGPGFKYQPREIQPTLYFVLGPPDVIPLPVDQGLCSLLFTLCRRGSGGGGARGYVPP